MHRPYLNRLLRAEMTALARMIMEYSTPQVVGEHWAAIQAGVHDNPESFLSFHRDYVRGLESYLEKEGMSKWVPLPKWDPALPIPEEFNIPSSGPGRLRNLNPNISFYPQFDRRNLINFKTQADLGMALMARHNTVHSTVGGVLNNLREAPQAPIFWAFHAFIDDIWHDWQESTVNVPSTIGLTYYQAYRVLVSSNLRPGRVRTSTRWNWPFRRSWLASSTVDSQLPQPGARALRGSPVELTLR